MPLRAPETDAVIDLRGLIELCYAAGRHHARLDYSADPEPSLSAADATWADELLRGAGLR